MANDPPYHHGDLRRVLIETGLSLIAESGARAFTMREVARRAGVSHNAPYRHFASRDDLIAAIATEGFERLSAAIRKGGSKGGTAVARLIKGSSAYISFANRWPSYYEVMFSPALQKDAYPECAEAAEESFSVLVRAIEDCQQNGSVRTGDSRSLARILWALLHGIAELSNAGQFSLGRAGSVTAFGKQAVTEMLAGIAPR
jgi:AcrR family transcriptional regulator